MILNDMIEARGTMMEFHRPGCWQVSPEAYDRMRMEAGRDNAFMGSIMSIMDAKTPSFCGIPIVIMDNWSAGWVMLTDRKAKAAGLPVAQ